VKPIFNIILLLLLASVSVFASIDDKKKKKSAKKKTTAHAKKPSVAPAKVISEIKTDDTTKIAINPDIFMDAVDSLLMFPSHDLYGNWDTCLIHPRLFDQHFTGDSATVYLLDDWNCGFAMPNRGPITSDFGWRRRQPHFGTDINLETGDTVVAAFQGKIRIARFNRGGYGNVVIIRHNNGLETVYAHLSKLLVEPGQEVLPGEVVGLGGNTGRSYGSHLHFEIRYLGKAVDTEDVIDYKTGDVKNSALILYKEDFVNKYDLRSIHARKKSKTHTTSKSQLSSKGGRIIIVKNGDTLEKIAKRNKTTISSICKKNGIKQSKVLRAGMRLKV